jgi:hypothetical protein
MPESAHRDADKSRVTPIWLPTRRPYRKSLGDLSLRIVSTLRFGRRVCISPQKGAEPLGFRCAYSIRVMKHGLFSDGLILLAVCSTVCCAQNKDEETPTSAQSIAELGQQLEKILAATHTPGLSVAIAHKDDVEWVAGLGQSDVATNHATTDETLFRVGSAGRYEVTGGSDTDWTYLG